MCRVLNGEKRKKDKPNAGIEPATLGYTRVDKSLEAVNIGSTNALLSIFTPRSTDWASQAYYMLKLAYRQI